MSSRLYKSIVYTIVYADVFDYPLKEKEIRNRLIEVESQKSGVKSIRQSQISLRETIKNSKSVSCQDGLYFLSGREDLVNIRRKREYWSKKKLDIARKTAQLMKIIPTVKLVGISGALAVGNAKEDDDIDFFIISSTGRLFTTRFLVTILINIAGQRRKPQDTNFNNKICLNMFVDEAYLEIPEEDRNLYMAYEVVQMKPLWYEGDTYQKFLSANQWVRKYLPNAIRIANHESRITERQKKKSLLNCSIAQLLHCIEKVMKNLQLRYMKSRLTKEIVSDHLIKFHPNNARDWVMSEYRKRLKKINIV